MIKLETPNTDSRWDDLFERLDQEERTLRRMHTVSLVVGALTSWIVGLLILFGEYSDHITKGLALVLIVARLAQELPKLVRMYTNWKRKRNVNRRS